MHTHNNTHTHTHTRTQTSRQPSENAHVVTVLCHWLEQSGACTCVLYNVIRSLNSKCELLSGTK